MSLYTALVIIEVLFVVALVVALTRPHRKVKTKAKVLGAEFELESEEAAGAEQAAAAPAEPGTAAAAPGIAAEGIRSGGRVEMHDGTGRGINAREVDAAGDVNLETNTPGGAPSAGDAHAEASTPDASKKA